MQSTSSYPHPVLGNNDDVDGDFEPIDFKVKSQIDYWQLSWKLKLKQSDLKRYLNSQYATVLVDVKCIQTLFRRGYVFDMTQVDDLQIDASDLQGKVEVSLYICATKCISSYNPTGIHQHLVAPPSDIDPGDILGLGGTYSFLADHEFDPLKSPVGSFMSISKRSEYKGPMTIHYSHEKIRLELQESDWKRYGQVKGDSRAEALLHSALVLPALVDALYTMRYNSSDHNDSIWYTTIAEICKKRRYNYTDDEPLEVAQKLLDDPIKRGMRALETLISDEDGE